VGVFCLSLSRHASRAFLCAREMDEDELEEYLDAIDQLDDRGEPAHYGHDELQEQLIDSSGHAVPGCYRTRPAPGQ